MTVPVPTRGAECPPSVELETFAAGGDATHEVHVASCAQCGPYVSALRVEADAFARARPPELFLKKLERAAQQPSPSRWRWLGLLLPVAAALALVVAFRGTEDDVTLKGGPFKVFLKRDDAASTPLPPDAQVHEKDALRFSYDAASDGYLAIFEVDGADAVTVFFPFGGTAAAPVKRAAGVLPGSVVLDAQRGPEWLVAVWSKTPFETAGLAAQLRGQATRATVALSCGDCVVSTQRIVKP